MHGLDRRGGADPSGSLIGFGLKFGGGLLGLCAVVIGLPLGALWLLACWATGCEAGR